MSVNYYSPVFAGYDAGAFTLPAPVVEARNVLARVKAAQLAHVAPDVSARHAEFVAAILAAPDAEQLPDPHRLVALEADNRAHQLGAGAIRDAIEQAEQGVVDALLADVPGLIVDCLRPVHAHAMKVARSHAALAPLVSGGPGVVAALTGSQRERADELAAAHEQYVAVRRAWGSLTRIGAGQRRDSEGVFSELYDLHERWPSYRQRGADQPWPMDPLGRFVWCAAHAKPWLPLPAEMEERYLEVYGDAIDQAARNREQMRGLAAVFG